MTARAVLVVGAGAIGQVYGHFLARGGARVTYYVRERYREQTARGVPLARLEARRRRRMLPVTSADVVSSPAEVAQHRFDQVYLTVPSDALVRPWLEELIAAVGDAIIVGLTPGAGDRDKLVAAGAVPERLVAGFLSLVAYQAPLPGEGAEVPACTTVWFPPGAPCLFSGPATARDEVLAALAAGGLPARKHRDVPTLGAFGSSATVAFMLALESGGWSLAELRQPTRMRQACAAMREIVSLTARDFGKPPLGVRLACRPWLLRTALTLAPRLAPFPLETYLRVHFTKVGEQTRHLVRAALERGRAAGAEAPALAALLESAQKAHFAETITSSK